MTLCIYLNNDHTHWRQLNFLNTTLMFKWIVNVKMFLDLHVYLHFVFFFSQVTFQSFATTGVPVIYKLDISQLCQQEALHFVFCVFFYSSNNLARIKWFGQSRMKHTSVLMMANNYRGRPGYLFALRCDFLENSHFLLIWKK